MGLASALSTALTGLTAAEATIDVVGNNVANASTIGFKSADAVFATQFVQTQSLGSAPTDASGGTNPRQIGLGTKVAEIKPNFNQGTIEVSSSPSDLAIQGDGFFIVQGPASEQLYTRNGILKTNAENELVTINGNRLLGFGVDDDFQIESTTLVPLTIPLGSKTVAQATQNVFFEGTLRPNGDIADTASIIRSGILGDLAIPAPTSVTGVTRFAVTGPTTAPTLALNAGGGALEAGTFTYRVVFVDAQGNESPPSPVSAGLTVAAGDRIDVTIPTDSGAAPANYVGRRVYRSLNGGTFYRLTVPDLSNNLTTLTFTDAASQASITVAGNELNYAPQPPGSRSHNYRFTFAHSLGSVEESRPSPIIGGGPITVVGDNRVKITGLPATVPPPYDRINIYRSLDADDSQYHLVNSVPLTPVSGGTEFIDGETDAEIATRQALDFDGPRIQASSTLLLDVVSRDGADNYERLFAEEGVLEFRGKKGGRTLAPKTFQVTSTSTVQDFVDFLEQALGIQEDTDPFNPIPQSRFGAGFIDPGGSVISTGPATDRGRIQLVGNNGRENALEIALSGLQFTGNLSGSVNNVNLPFGTIQEAVGESAVADFIAFDSLGIPVAVRITVVQESRDNTSTTYRWFADSPDHQPADGSATIAVGTGLIQFDSEGNVITVTETTVSIDRREVTSTSPLEFELDFTELSGLAVPESSLAASRQDGSQAGTLSSFIIGEDGKIRGVFSNGVTRDLGQIRLARFANNSGLEQKGENLYAAGVNSGLPIQGNPGQQGIGRIIAGALELSNTDIGANLIDLILASTQYRGNARVIESAQRLLDELLNLRR
jgi:flagellar hook protein FlgE